MNYLLVLSCFTIFTITSAMHSHDQRAQGLIDALREAQNKHTEKQIISNETREVIKELKNLDYEYEILKQAITPNLLNPSALPLFTQQYQELARKTDQLMLRAKLLDLHFSIL